MRCWFILAGASYDVYWRVLGGGAGVGGLVVPTSMLGVWVEGGFCCGRAGWTCELRVCRLGWWTAARLM